MRATNRTWDGSSSTSQREKLLEGSDMDLKGARWGEGGGGEGCENKKRREREWVEGEGEKGKRRGRNEGSTTIYSSQRKVMVPRPLLKKSSAFLPSDGLTLAHVSLDLCAWDEGRKGNGEQIELTFLPSPSSFRGNKFTHRTQILSLYRQLLRSTRCTSHLSTTSLEPARTDLLLSSFHLSTALPTPSARKDTLAFYRPEFKIPYNPPPSSEKMQEHVGRVRRLVQRLPWQGGAL